MQLNLPGKILVLGLAIMAFSIPFTVLSQITVKGKVKEAGSDEPLTGVNISIQNTTEGAVSDVEGNFVLKTNTPPPFSLVFSFIGFDKQEIEVSGPMTDLLIEMVERPILGQEVVISASRVEENIMASPVTIEKMSSRDVEQIVRDLVEAWRRPRMVVRQKGFRLRNGLVRRELAYLCARKGAATVGIGSEALQQGTGHVVAGGFESPQQRVGDVQDQRHGGGPRIQVPRRSSSRLTRAVASCGVCVRRDHGHAAPHATGIKSRSTEARARGFNPVSVTKSTRRPTSSSRAARRFT